MQYTGFFLLAMINLSVFGVVKRNLGSYPVIQEKVIKSLLIPLAIADVSRPSLSSLSSNIFHDRASC